MLKRTVIVVLSVVMLFSAVGVVGAQGPDDGRPISDRFGKAELISGALLREAANQLGVSARDLIANAEEGQTVSEIITANGGDVVAISNAVKEQLISRLDTALENERIDQERYDEMLAGLDEAIAQGLNNPVPQHDRSVGDRERLHQNFNREAISIVSEALGLTPEEILSQLREGKTVGVIITENGGDVDAITAQIVASVSEHINEAVANGELDAERAETLLSNLETRITEWLNRTERPTRDRNGIGANTDSSEGVLE
ncbi:MAG: hypothetical protein CUN55_06735 [Phototrophicales bacterium]|nr:MAG: hypothetical protein CUN55_06735 [Phototrophicales bacterium]